jgi:hypothetical protein
LGKAHMTPSPPISLGSGRCERLYVVHSVVGVEYYTVSWLFFTDWCIFCVKVFFATVQSGGCSQIYFMTLGQNSLFNWWALWLKDNIQRSSQKQHELCSETFLNTEFTL